MNRGLNVLAGRAYAPAWLTTGLFLGGLWGWYLFRPVPAATMSASRQTPEAVVPAAVGGLAEVEKLFRIWGGYAVWEDDLTEIAVMRAQPGRIQPEYYQVSRVGRAFYFRTLSHLTRPLIDHGGLARCMLAFTEPRWMHEQYYREHPAETPGAYRPEELVARSSLLPPRPPVTAEAAAESKSRMMPVAGLPVQPSTKPDQPAQAQPRTTPENGGGG